MSFEFSRCKLCAKLASLERSHSQELELSGRPNTVRKYDWLLKELSAYCTARVPTGNPLKLGCEPVIWLMAS